MSVAVLVYAGVLELELGAALTVCSLAGGEGACRTVARSRASIVGASGLVTTPELMFAALEPPVAVFVPGGPGALKASRDPLVRTFLGAQRERGILLAASGSGVLLLGEAGLLADRVVTTSPDLADTVWGFDPADVRTGELSEDGAIVTARGGLGALDAALRVAARCWGEERAALAAQRLGR